MTDAERITSLEERIAGLEARLAIAEAKTPTIQPWPVYIPQPYVLPRPQPVQPVYPYYGQIQTICSSQDTTVSVNS